jgi:hypothetical protein
MVNRESLPLIFAIMIPIVLVSLILLYIYGYDVTSFFRKIDPIYYVIVAPIALGFLAAIMRWKKMD